MVHLRREPADFDPEIVDNGPVLGTAKVEVDEVRGVALAVDSRLDRPDLILEPFARCLYDAIAVEQPLEGSEVGLAAVRVLDDHEARGSPCGSCRGRL